MMHRTKPSLLATCLLVLGSLACVVGGEDRRAEGLDHPEPKVRIAAVAVIAARGGPESDAALKRALADPQWNVQMAAAKVLGPRAEPAILDDLIGGLESDDHVRRRGCVLALARNPSRRASDALMTRCDKGNFAFRWQAAEAIARAQNRAFIPMMLAVLRDGADWRVQEVATVALAGMQEVVGIDPLLQALRSEEPYARRIACWQLGLIGDPRAIDVLIADILHKHDTYEGRVWGAHAIVMIGRQLDPPFEAVVADLANDRPEKHREFEQAWAKSRHRYVMD